MSRSGAARAFIRKPRPLLGDSWNPGVLHAGPPPLRRAARLIKHYGREVESMIEAKKKLEEDIRTAEHELKVELPKEIQRAREWGDLRENAEYKAAKERQTFLQARIAQLQGRLAGLSMMNLDNIPKDKVGLGSTVHVRDEDTGEENTYDIVTSEESDPEKGRISPSSPIGRCLLNKKVGEVAEVRVPKGTRYVEIMKLATIHDPR